MKRMLLAAAIVAIPAAAMPVYAQTGGTSTSPQAEPPMASAPAASGGGEQTGGAPWMHGRGSEMHGGPMMHREMWHRAMMRRDPQERCIDRLAWRAARLAYVEAKLDLTDQQRPLWDKLHSIAQGAQQKERQLCQSLKPDEELTALERMDRAQRFLSAKLDALQAAKPAVQSLYQSLSPEQKEIFDHPFRDE